MTEKTPKPKEKPSCAYCGDSGIIHPDHFMELGEDPLVPCPRCVIPRCKCGGEEPYFYREGGRIIDCSCRPTRMRIDRVKKIYNHSGIDRKFQWKYLGDYDASRSKMANDAKMAAYDIINKFPDVKKGLFFWGNPGTGKTLLSSIILTELITRYTVEGRFIKISRDFFSRLKATFNEASSSYGQSHAIEKELAEVDVLIVDDFGVQRDSPWEQETLYNLVDARYEAEKFTIFTSNYDPVKTFRELSAGRILSRLREMCRIMELTGEDYRESL